MISSAYYLTRCEEGYSGTEVVICDATPRAVSEPRLNQSGGVSTAASDLFSASSRGVDGLNRVRSFAGREQVCDLRLLGLACRPTPSPSSVAAGLASTPHGCQSAFELDVAKDRSEGTWFLIAGMLRR